VGERPSFAEVYDECHRSVYALCRSLTGNDADAKDAMQDAFISVARALASFRGESAVKTWVHRIAIRTALRNRATSRRRTHDDVDDGEHAGTDHVRTERLEVSRALDELPVEHRVVLAMFAVEGMTHPEIAAVLGIPEGTVWSRLHAAKRKMAESLAGSADARGRRTG